MGRTGRRDRSGREVGEERWREGRGDEMEGKKKGVRGGYENRRPTRRRPGDLTEHDDINGIQVLSENLVQPGLVT